MAEVIDANAARMSDEEVAEQVARLDPLLVGISLYSDILPPNARPHAVHPQARSRGTACAGRPARQCGSRGDA